LKTDYFKLHFIVLLLGFTAILGKLISISAIDLVWYRTLFGMLAILAFLLWKKRAIKLPTKDVFMLLGIGVVVGAHWMCFFQAIKVSNVSLTLACLSTTTLFTAIAEPLTQKRRISLLEVFIGFAVIIGLNTIFRFEPQYIEGIIYAVICAILAGIFSIMNKNISHRFDPMVLNFYEMSGAFITTFLFIIFSGNLSSFPVVLPLNDYIFLAILGVVCTAYAFAALVELMKRLSAYAIILTINLEPIYGILIALPLFGDSEVMTSGFYFGALIILASVFGYFMLKKISLYRKKRI